MKKLLTIVSCLLLLTACTSKKEMSYKDHLNKAEEALAAIEFLIEGEKGTAFVPVAYADGPIDEAKVVEHANTAVDEIDNAQDAVNEIGDNASKSDAQSEVDQTADRASETLEKAESAVESDEAKRELQDAQNEIDAMKEDQENLDKLDEKPFIDEDGDGVNDFDQETEQLLEDYGEAHSNEKQDEADRGDNNNEQAAASAAKEGLENNGTEANYEAFKKKTGVDFQPIYEGTDESPIDEQNENLFENAEQDLTNRTKLDEAAKLEEPTLDEAAIEKAMQELIQ